MKTPYLVGLLVAVLCLFTSTAHAETWRSSLYDADWVPPQQQASPPSFETDKLIQDFSYAGYRRSEVELPEVTGPIFDAVEDFGADPSGDSDTTSQLQDAIDVASDAGGGVVYLEAGTYRISPPGDAPASLRIRSSNVILHGIAGCRDLLHDKRCDTDDGFTDLRRSHRAR